MIKKVYLEEKPFLILWVFKLKNSLIEFCLCLELHIWFEAISCFEFYALDTLSWLITALNWELSFSSSLTACYLSFGLNFQSYLIYFRNQKSGVNLYQWKMETNNMSSFLWKFHKELSILVKETWKVLILWIN